MLEEDNYILRNNHIVKAQIVPIKRQNCFCCDILIVDDEKLNVRALKLILKKLKLNADSCFDGSEAIEKVKFNTTKTCCNIQYKLIFMDLMMPKVKGDEASRAIKKSTKKETQSIFLI